MPDILKFLELLPILVLVYGVLRYLIRTFFSHAIKKEVSLPRKEESFSGEGEEQPSQPFGDIFGDTKRSFEEMLGNPLYAGEEASVDESSVPKPLLSPPVLKPTLVKETDDFAFRYRAGDAVPSAFHSEFLDTFSDGVGVQQALIAGEILRPKFD